MVKIVNFMFCAFHHNLRKRVYREGPSYSLRTQSIGIIELPPSMNIFAFPYPVLNSLDVRILITAVRCLPTVSLSMVSVIRGQGGPEADDSLSPPYLNPGIFTLAHSFFLVSKSAPLFSGILTSTCLTGVEEEGRPSQQVAGPSVHLNWCLLSGLKEDKFCSCKPLPLPLTPRFRVTHTILLLTLEGSEE